MLVTGVLFTYDALHVPLKVPAALVQVIPLGDAVTVPVPVPLPVTTKAKFPTGIRRRIIVEMTVEELPATSLGYGGGLEAARLFLDRTTVRPRGFFEIGRRNLFGKNRSIDFF